MATKAESAGPLHISSSDKLLSSVISLPPKPHIVYTVFTPPPTNPPGSYESIELARRQILIRNGSSPILESILYSVHIDNLDSGLYVFAITAHDRITQCRSTISQLKLDGLNGENTSVSVPSLVLNHWQPQIYIHLHPRPCIHVLLLVRLNVNHVRLVWILQLNTSYLLKHPLSPLVLHQPQHVFCPASLYSAYTHISQRHCATV